MATKTTLSTLHLRLNERQSDILRFSLGCAQLNGDQSTEQLVRAMGVRCAVDLPEAFERPRWDECSQLFEMLTAGQEVGV